ncbi:MAG TPA: hypothetical protein DD490_34270 [Acidobacteria bacterium]|nr:hypothetical protein [Acidobacteriota bacterium]
MRPDISSRLVLLLLGIGLLPPSPRAAAGPAPEPTAVDVHFVTAEAWGRSRLIAHACDQRKLLASYNEAARRQAGESEEPVTRPEGLLAVGALGPPAGS